ncbi:MAG: hypothetical protein MT334_04705 [Candidatus Nitrosopumilus limneticus]|nr:hypothetical protein [Candidatus Nitrosopumilus limneticus]MDC4212470.1 hypothetical protein [Candidatus Nitrosopumilus limneticus]MDC4213911.1 hypothetical protein [Candidatus Nitrosopumilus limneticus]MDC4215806.1 hypothetical protein [Candidatus Nitrosopumilus limneticus]MDC4216745.1 hypothetical protein [Candidatus Nitrosopumilus limneticus]
MSFEKELEKGQFCIPECISCKKLIWPPSEFCNLCNRELTLNKSEFEGKIIEFSRQDENYFCIVEFNETVRLIAKMETCPKKNQTVKISKCGISQGSYYFHII